ncbi:MAG TPA: SH3 domain-containing protein, partial [Opitutaceae bacterium]|nr:SH3 domain-containing protein [Opitutaceae bacterium]
MKIKFILFLAWLASLASLSAASVPATTAVHARPSDNAPVISYLKAGSSPVFATATPAPAGWAAVELEGPFESYIMRKDLNKSLDPRPGAEIHLLPDPASPVLTVAEKGDKADITGQFRGKWTQINLTKKIVGYIHVGNSAVLAPVLTDTVAPAPAAPLDPAPVPTSAHGFA